MTRIVIEFRTKTENDAYLSEQLQKVAEALLPNIMGADQHSRSQ